MQVSSHKTKGNARATVARAQEAPPHHQKRADERRAGRGKNIWTEASLCERANMAERSPDVSCAKKKVAENSLLSQRKMTKKSEGGEMVVSNTSLQVLDREDKARIVFFYGGVKGCQISSELRSHKRKSACAEGALAQGTPQHL